MAKERSPIPQETRTKVLFEHDWACCVCWSKNVSLQLHHIDNDPTNHDPENLAALCLEHHDDTQTTGGFGRRLGLADVRQYRDDWISRVKTRKDKADELAVLRLSGSEDKEVSSPLTPDPLNWAGPPPDQLLFAYLETLPPTKRAAKEAAQSLYDTGITRNMSEGSYLVAETFEQMWLRLAKWFPPNHFGSAPADYWSEYLAQRGRWHRVLLDREGPGSSGTSASVYSAGRVMNDADLMIIQTVEALVQGTTFDLGKWITRWNGAEKEDEKLGRQLDDLFAEGVKIRNRLLAPMTSYDDVGERKVMNDWSDRVVRKLGDAGITIGPISRFRTLDRFEAKTMGDPSRSSAQVHLEAIMNEKLDRLRAIIDTSDR